MPRLYNSMSCTSPTLLITKYYSVHMCELFFMSSSILVLYSTDLVSLVMKLQKLRWWKYCLFVKYSGSMGHRLHTFSYLIIYIYMLLYKDKVVGYFYKKN